MAKLVPFSTIVGTEEELLLVAAGKMRLPDVGSENSEPLIPEILSRSALEGETSSSKFR
ncbi:MAG: hypothetical protein WB762_24540 [Candidatus Sulfotelmatobacter sp.]